jgi:hypothetical protein
MQGAQHRAGGFSNFDAGFAAYENGKHRRYELLFAVNGGAFALVKLLPIIAKASPDPAKVNEILTDPKMPFLGQLSVNHVALGMIAFTVIMFIDIAAFGRAIRKWHYRIYPEKQKWRPGENIFSLIGFFVLFALCTLICSGWYLVQDILPCNMYVLAVLSAFFVVCPLWYLWWEVRLKK